jgi:hypothetical protein
MLISLQKPHHRCRCNGVRRGVCPANHGARSAEQTHSRDGGVARLFFFAGGVRLDRTRRGEDMGAEVGEMEVEEGALWHRRCMISSAPFASADIRFSIGLPKPWVRFGACRLRSFHPLGIRFPTNRTEV